MHGFSTIQNTFLNALYNSIIKQAKNSIQYCQNLQNVQESIIANRQKNERWQNATSFVSSQEKYQMNGWLEQNVQKPDFERNTSPKTAKLISIKDQFKNKFTYEFDDKFGKTKPKIDQKLTHQQICDTLNRKIREAKNMEMKSAQIRSNQINTTMVCPNVEIRLSVLPAALPSKMSNGIVILRIPLKPESYHQALTYPLKSDVKPTPLVTKGVGGIGADWAKTVPNTVQSHLQARPKSAEHGVLCRNRKKI